MTQKDDSIVVSSEDVIAAYEDMLNECNRRLALLQAQVAKLTRDASRAQEEGRQRSVMAVRDA